MKNHNKTGKNIPFTSQQERPNQTHGLRGFFHRVRDRFQNFFSQLFRNEPGHSTPRGPRITYNPVPPGQQTPIIPDEGIPKGPQEKKTLGKPQPQHPQEPTWRGSGIDMTKLAGIAGNNIFFPPSRRSRMSFEIERAKKTITTELEEQRRYGEQKNRPSPKI